MRKVSLKRLWNKACMTAGAAQPRMLTDGKGPRQFLAENSRGHECMHIGVMQLCPQAGRSELVKTMLRGAAEQALPLAGVLQCQCSQCVTSG